MTPPKHRLRTQCARTAALPLPPSPSHARTATRHAARRAALLSRTRARFSLPSIHISAHSLTTFFARSRCFSSSCSRSSCRWLEALPCRLADGKRISHRRYRLAFSSRSESEPSPTALSSWSRLRSAASVISWHCTWTASCCALPSSSTLRGGRARRLPRGGDGPRSGRDGHYGCSAAQGEHGRSALASGTRSVGSARARASRPARA